MLRFLGTLEFLMKLPHHLAKESGKEILHHLPVIVVMFIVYLRHN